MNTKALLSRILRLCPIILLMVEFIHSRVILKVMFISLQFKLEFENKQDGKRILSLMCMQSSAIRFIYNRLVALVLPLLERSFTEDFSPLKPVIIEGKRQRRASELVPSGFGGTIG